MSTPLLFCSSGINLCSGEASGSPWKVNYWPALALATPRSWGFQHSCRAPLQMSKVLNPSIKWGKRGYGSRRVAGEVASQHSAQQCLQTDTELSLVEEMLLKGPGTRSSPPSEEAAPEKQRKVYGGGDLKGTGHRERILFFLRTSLKYEDSWGQLLEISKTLMCLVSANYAAYPPPAKTQGALSFPKANKWGKRTGVLPILTAPGSRGSWQGQTQWCCLLGCVCCALRAAEGPAIAVRTKIILFQ